MTFWKRISMIYRKTYQHFGAPECCNTLECRGTPVRTHWFDITTRRHATADFRCSRRTKVKIGGNFSRTSGSAQASERTQTPSNDQDNRRHTNPQHLLRTLMWFSCHRRQVWDSEQQRVWTRSKKTKTFRSRCRAGILPQARQEPLSPTWSWRARTRNLVRIAFAWTMQQDRFC